MSQREEDRMNAADASIQRRASAVLVDFFFHYPIRAAGGRFPVAWLGPEAWRLFLARSFVANDVI